MRCRPARCGDRCARRSCRIGLQARRRPARSGAGAVEGDGAGHLTDADRAGRALVLGGDHDGEGAGLAGLELAGAAEHGRDDDLVGGLHGRVDLGAGAELGAERDVEAARGRLDGELDGERRRDDPRHHDVRGRAGVEVGDVGGERVSARARERVLTQADVGGGAVVERDLALELAHGARVVEVTREDLEAGGGGVAAGRVDVEAGGDRARRAALIGIVGTDGHIVIAGGRPVVSARQHQSGQHAQHEGEATHRKTPDRLEWLEACATAIPAPRIAKPASCDDRRRRTACAWSHRGAGARTIAPRTVDPAPAVAGAGAGRGSRWVRGTDRSSAVDLCSVRVAEFSFDTLLYEGASTLVYAGVREPDGAPVVAKMVRDAHRSLTHEYRVLQKVVGSRVVVALGLFEGSDGPVLVERRYGSSSLAAALRPGRFTVRRALRVALQVAQACGQVHAARFIHRDIKPANILYDAGDETATLCDFGTAAELPVNARALPVCDLVGTPAYVSPEHTGRTREGCDVRSDLYSLGITLYELLTGGLPFPDKDLLEIVAAQLSRLPEPPHHRVPSVPLVVSEIVRKLLAKLPDERYQSARGLAADL
ncbi:MAG: serine/threonine protein kinase, partial [Deltaproteobacteria bacterium]